MLSTPIARIRKGITSALIIVKPIPKYDMNPIEASKDARTMRIPMIASVNPALTLEGKTPIATPMYMNIAV
jgi:hypothetical protein